MPTLLQAGYLWAKHLRRSLKDGMLDCSSQAGLHCPGREHYWHNRTLPSVERQSPIQLKEQLDGLLHAQPSSVEIGTGTPFSNHLKPQAHSRNRFAPSQFFAFCLQKKRIQRWWKGIPSFLESGCFPICCVFHSAAT